MLILSRRKDERLIIDGRIQIAVIDIRGDQVKLGIEAPRDVKVFRNEVFEAMKSENRAAVDSPAVLPNLEELSDF